MSARMGTPGSGGLGGNAGAISYRDKTVKAHDKFWPVVDKVEPILTDLRSKLHELSQSHLTVMGPFMRMRHQRSFSNTDSYHMLRRMDVFRDEVVQTMALGRTDHGDTWEWKVSPETGERLPETGANISPLTDIALTIYQEQEAFLRVLQQSINNTPTLATCDDADDLEAKLAIHVPGGT